jgi:hypothetical protein
MLPTCVAGEIAVYEYDCRGTSRREDMVTGSFRQECDTRGRCKQPVRAAAPAEQCSAPVAPTLTTLEHINADADGSLPAGTTGGNDRRVLVLDPGGLMSSSYGRPATTETG